MDGCTHASYLARNPANTLANSLKDFLRFNANTFVHKCFYIMLVVAAAAGWSISGTVCEISSKYTTVFVLT